MTQEEMAALLVNQCEMVYWGSLNGAGVPVIRRRFEAMSTFPPQIGELILIGSVSLKTPALDRIGYLVRLEDEPSYIREDAKEPLPHPTRYWTIRTLDGREFRWTNVQVTRVITERFGGDPEPVREASK